MQSIHISAQETTKLIQQTLEERFPGVLFALRLDTTVPVDSALRGLDVVWIEGPRREDVEGVLEPFQGLDWDPRTGAFESAVHFSVNDTGELVAVNYGIDYIFCDGPAQILHG